MKAQLPSKEQALFRSILKFYEAKQYKRGLKSADGVLKKFPQHGETWAMRGLILNCLNRKEEAYENIRKGLKFDLRSHVCWHVYGLIYRSDRDYHEAIKCYTNALKIDPDNLQILRDLYLLQIQIRDTKGYAESRRSMLTLKPNIRNNWIGFAVAHHLDGNLQMAIDIIDKYEETLIANRELDYEESEMLLYRIQILEEKGDYQTVLEHLEKYDKHIRDRIGAKQTKAECLLQLHKFDEAKAIFEELLDLNGDNYEYHRGFQCCVLENAEPLRILTKCELPASTLQLQQNDPKRMALVAFYKSMSNRIAERKELVWLRAPLEFTCGQEFEEMLDTYLRRQLTRGVPSLGTELKFLYKPEFQAQLEVFKTLLTSYLKSLSAQPSTFPGDDNVETPMTWLWTMFLAAQHYDRMNDHVKALEYIDKCIEHTPTILDFYQRKARILKHAGALKEAADLMVEARMMDLADRYSNNKATEYLLKSGRIEEAESTITLFTRHEDNPERNLFDMQCMWYEIDAGYSQMRRNVLNRALKYFFAVEKHFNDIDDDQVDFHTYCIRKMTLRAYVQMLRTSDKLYSFEFYQKAAHGAIQCYLKLYDSPAAPVGAEGGDKYANMTAAEKKKAKRLAAKARKQEYKRKEEQEQKAEAAKDKETKKKPNNQRRDIPVDKDPHGDELLGKNPLEESWRFVNVLQKHCSDRIWTHLYAFEVAMRKQKHLLCLQALNRAAKVTAGDDVNEAQVLKRTIQLFVSLDKSKPELHPTVSKLIDEQRKALLQGFSLQQKIEEFVKSHPAQSLPCRRVVAETYMHLDQVKYQSNLLELLTNTSALERATHSEAAAAYELLASFDSAQASKYKTACASRYPLSSVFASGYPAC